MFGPNITAEMSVEGPGHQSPVHSQRMLLKGLFVCLFFEDFWPEKALKEHSNLGRQVVCYRALKVGKQAKRSLFWT